MIGEWHDISRLPEFEKDYKYHDYMVQRIDGNDDGYMEACEGIGEIYPGAVRFYCLPNDNDDFKWGKL